jgi:hypothetical protein
MANRMKIGWANYTQSELNMIQRKLGNTNSIVCKNGHPDLFIFDSVKKEWYWVEIQSYKKKITKVQKEMIEQYRKAGFRVEIWKESYSDYLSRINSEQQNTKLPNVLNMKTYNFNPIKKEDNDFDIIINKLQSLLEEIKLYQRS